jgi:hypothetical protein
MSFHAWQEKYGSDPSVVGSTYQINGRCVHDHRRGPGRFHWGEDDELGHAGYLDAADGRAVDVGDNGAN